MIVTHRVLGWWQFGNLLIKRISEKLDNFKETIEIF